MRKRLGKIRGFSIQFLPYSEIRGLDGNQRIRKILNIVLGNNILILQGRLDPEEETRLIGDTMAMIGHVRNNPSILDFNDLGLQFVKSHDNVGHGLGYADFNNDNFDSVMNNTSGRTTPRPVETDEVVGVCAADVSPGNRSPDTNP